MNGLVLVKSFPLQDFAIRATKSFTMTSSLHRHCGLLGSHLLLPMVLRIGICAHWGRLLKSIAARAPEVAMRLITRNTRDNILVISSFSADDTRLW